MAFSTAPVTISPLTQFMAESYDDTDLRMPGTGFQAFFARNNPLPTFVDNQRGFSYDIVRGSKTISKMLTRENAARSLGTDAKPNVEMKYQNHAFVFPTITESNSAEWEQTLERIAGEDAFGSLTREQRFGILLAKGASQSMSRAVGRIEKMAVESLTLGTVTLDDTAGSSYDFDRATTNTFAAPAVWSGASTPLVDLDNLARAITQNGGMPPNFVVFGREVTDAFIRNTTVSGIADNRRYWFIEAGSERSIAALPPNLQWMVEAGFIHIGNVRTMEGRDFPIFNYLEQYQTDALVWTDYFDTKGVFMGYSDAPMNRYFGPSLTIPPTALEQQQLIQKLGIDPTVGGQMPTGTAGVVDPRMFRWDFDVPTGAQTAALLRTHTSPIYIPTAVDMFGKITGVVA
jgi:hypothetical protein